MDLNIKTESTVLKMTLESGLVLNLQIPKPIQLTIANGMYWGGIGGNIERQADLMLLLSGKAPLQHQHVIADVAGLADRLNKIEKLAKAGIVL